MLIDSHAHLTDPKLPGSVAEVLDRARAAGVERVLCVGQEPADWQAVLQLAEAHHGVYAILGLHPNRAGIEDGWLERLADLLGHPKVVALGEIGLDFYHHYVPAEAQRAAFERQLELARRLDLPVVLHTRDSGTAVRATLRRHGLQKGVFHSFSGTWEEAKEVLDLGFALSFSGPLTFTNAPELREIAARLPHERVLIETDAPYLSPHPWRDRPNEPARVRRVAEMLAQTWDVGFEEAARVTSENAESLFDL